MRPHHGDQSCLWIRLTCYPLLGRGDYILVRYHVVSEIETITGLTMEFPERMDFSLARCLPPEERIWVRRLEYHRYWRIRGGFGLLGARRSARRVCRGVSFGEVLGGGWRRVWMMIEPLWRGVWWSALGCECWYEMSWLLGGRLSAV